MIKIHKSNPAIEKALKAIFEAISNLKDMHKGRKFTPDGRFVGDIGEIIAQLDYCLELTEKSQPLYDAVSLDNGTKIQIKTTFQNQLGFMKAYADNNIHYLGFKVNQDGSYEEIFNGPASVILEECKENKRICDGRLVSLSVSRLRKLSESTKCEKIPRRLSNDLE